MTRKKQNKILDDKIESNVNQYKVDRLNAEISAFSSGDLNKYEFLTRKHLNYKPNALDKARFEFSPLGQTFSIGLDKTAQGYQEEGVIKLLKDIRDGLARAPLGPGGPGGPRVPPGPGPDSENDDNTPDLETEEEAAERIADSYEQQKKDNYDSIMKDLGNSVNKLKDRILYLDARIKDSEFSNKEKDKLNKNLIESNHILENFIEIYNDIINKDQNNKINTLNDEISKIKYAIKNKNLTSNEKNELQNKIKELETQKNSINSKFRRTINVIKKKKESEESEKFMKNMILTVLMKVVFIKILLQDIILMVLIEMVLIEMVLIEMVFIVIVLMKMVFINILLQDIILMVLIEMVL